MDKCEEKKTSSHLRRLPSSLFLSSYNPSRSRLRRCPPHTPLSKRSETILLVWDLKKKLSYFQLEMGTGSLLLLSWKPRAEFSGSCPNAQCSKRQIRKALKGKAMVCRLEMGGHQQTRGGSTPPPPPRRHTANKFCKHTFWCAPAGTQRPRLNSIPRSTPSCRAPRQVTRPVSEQNHTGTCKPWYSMGLGLFLVVPQFTS